MLEINSRPSSGRSLLQLRFCFETGNAKSAVALESHCIMDHFPCRELCSIVCLSLIIMVSKGNSYILLVGRHWRFFLNLNTLYCGMYNVDSRLGDSPVSSVACLRACSATPVSKTPDLPKLDFGEVSTLGSLFRTWPFSKLALSRRVTPLFPLVSRCISVASHPSTLSSIYCYHTHPCWHQSPRNPMAYRMALNTPP